MNRLDRLMEAIKVRRSIYDRSMLLDAVTSKLEAL